eukprot:SAG31_NODE_4741_length_2988_cov_1.101419_3_plen_115_part_00
MVYKFRMRRLATEVGTVSAPVTFRRGHGRFKGRQLASTGKSVRATDLRVARQRNKELRGNKAVLNTDLSAGAESPWTITVLNEINAEIIDPVGLPCSRCKMMSRTPVCYHSSSS